MQLNKKKGEDVYTVQFRIAQNKEKKPVAIIVLPSFLKTDDGLRISFSGLEKTIEKDEFRCTPTFCISGFPFEGFVQSAITQSSRIGFSYTALGFNPSEEEKAIKITMKMDGYAPRQRDFQPADFAVLFWKFGDDGAAHWDRLFVPDRDNHA